MLFSRIMTTVNFVLGASALSFQVFALYPWHMELDRKFELLKAEQERTAKRLEKQLLEELRILNTRTEKDLNEVRQLSQPRRFRWL